MCTVKGFFHVGITVGEMARSVEFYVQGLGLEFDWERHGATDQTRELIGLDFESLHNVFLSIPGGGSVELIEYKGIDRVRSTSRSCDPGTGHFCLYVEGIDAFAERARRHGGRSRSEHAVGIESGVAAGSSIVYMEDPDGFVVELFERPESDTKIDSESTLAQQSIIDL